MNRFRKVIAGLALAAAVITPAGVALSQTAPNPDPTLAAEASSLRDHATQLDTDATDLHSQADQLRSEADALDAYVPPEPTTTTTLPPTTTTLPPTTTVPPTTTTTTVPPLLGPDMIVVSATPNSAAAGQHVVWSTVVKNIGDTPTPAGVPVGVGITVDVDTVHTYGWTNTPIAAGQQVQIDVIGGDNFPYWLAVAGTHVAHVRVDDVNRFVESNETNNALDLTVNVSGSLRDATVWPFAPTSPWNTPRGDGATFDARTVTSGDVRVSSTNGFGVCVGGAGYALNTTCSTATNHEGHYSIIQPNKTSADEYYQGSNCSLTGCTGFINHMVTDITSSGVNVGYDIATKLSQLGGLVRQADLTSGVIPHALQAALASNILSSGVVWPAFDGDGYKSSNTGFVPYGALLAIPSNVAKPAGLSATGSMLWDAAVKYGVYVVDGNGAVPANPGVMTFRWEPSVAVPPTADMNKIGLALRMVTNSSQANVGGPGNRLAPQAPPLG